MNNEMSERVCRSKAETWLSAAVPIAFLLFYGIVCYLFSRYSAFYAEGLNSLCVTECGRCLLNFIWWGAGLCGVFFMCASTGESRLLRAVIWGAFQLVGAWFFAYPTAHFCMPFLGDGLGMALIMLAPLATLPSYLVALLVALLLRGRMLRFYVWARVAGLGLLLLFMVSNLVLFLQGEARAREENCEEKPYECRGY